MFITKAHTHTIIILHTYHLFCCISSPVPLFCSRDPNKYMFPIRYVANPPSLYPVHPKVESPESPPRPSHFSCKTIFFWFNHKSKANFFPFFISNMIKQIILQANIIYIYIYIYTLLSFFFFTILAILPIELQTIHPRHLLEFGR